MNLLVIGCYTFDDKDEVCARFVRDFQRSGTHGELSIVTELPEGEYGITHTEKYIDILKNLPNVSHVVTTDIRDVLIQGPIHAIPLDSLTFYLEDIYTTIGSCPFNSHWIRRYYGLEWFDLMKNRPIANPSIVSGKREDVIRYLERLFSEMKKVNNPGNGIDMACHNFLMASGDIDCIALDNRGPVYTVGHTKEIRVSKHRILNEQGEIPIIVHQYDRHVEAL